MDETTAARIGHNEALFRVVNEQINQFVPDAAGAFEIVCECGDVDCRKLISVTPEVYAQVRAEPTWFFVRADHQMEEVETVVEVIESVEGATPLDTYFIVEKHKGLPKLVAELTDPRG